MIFQVERGNFWYENGTPLLRDISFGVPASRVAAVLGPNGVGKTTLLKCMMGLLRWRSGRSTLDGEDIGGMRQKALWSRVAYVPQGKGIPLPYSAEEMVVLGRSVHMGMLAQPKAGDYEKAYRAMDEVGIGHLRKKICARMSGGEFQMVLIARALVTRPSILVLDEPESNLDFKNQIIVLETIRRMADERGITCIFNTHYPDHALRIADDALLLDRDGRAEFGPSGDIISPENMRRAFEVTVHIHRLTLAEREFASVIPVALEKPGRVPT